MLFRSPCFHRFLYLGLNDPYADLDFFFGSISFFPFLSEFTSISIFSLSLSFFKIALGIEWFAFFFLLFHEMFDIISMVYCLQYKLPLYFIDLCISYIITTDTQQYPSK